jgi:hypothetical protein
MATYAECVRTTSLEARTTLDECPDLRVAEVALVHPPNRFMHSCLAQRGSAIHVFTQGVDWRNTALIDCHQPAIWVCVVRESLDGVLAANGLKPE